MFAGRVFRFDPVLFFSTGIILLCGVFILFSASGGSTEIIFQQGIRIAIAIIVMLGVAQIDPDVIRRWSPAIYLVTILILMLLIHFSHNPHHFQTSKLHQIELVAYLL